MLSAINATYDITNTIFFMMGTLFAFGITDIDIGKQIIRHICVQNG